MPTIQSISYVKAHFAQVIDEVTSSRQPVFITQNGNGTAVIQDHYTYQRTQDALAMLKLMAMGQADAAAGRTIPQDEVFRGIRKELAARKAAEGRADGKKRKRA
jgi:prevent-host-death family protein